MERTIFSTLPLPPAHEHWDYHVFLIGTLVFTRLLLDEIYLLIELPFEWLIDEAMFVYLMNWYNFCYSNLTLQIGGSPLYYKRTDESILLVTSHPATRRRGNVVTTSLCTSQRRRRYVSNETPNDVSVERRQDVSVVRLHDVLLVCRDDVPWGRNDDVPSVRLHDVSNKSQMKHPTTSQWYVSTTSH